MIKASLLLPRTMDPATIRRLVAFLRGMDIRPIIEYGDTDGPCVDAVPMEATQAVAEAIEHFLR